MEKLTIKLLHERRSNSSRRKIEGRSGMTHIFEWSAEHKAYVFTTTEQEKVDDIFNGMGRVGGSYFAPVITLAKVEPAKPLSEDNTLELLMREIELPKALPASIDPNLIAKALVEAYDHGAAGAAKATAAA